MRSNPIRFPASETLWNERHRKESVTSKSHLPREGIERWQHKGTALLTLGREPVVRMPGVRAPISRARRALRPPCHRSHVVAGGLSSARRQAPFCLCGPSVRRQSCVCARARQPRVPTVTWRHYVPDLLDSYRSPAPLHSDAAHSRSIAAGGPAAARATTQRSVPAGLCT
ncbi:hypothetical protein MRX96_023418 [Rhipicephalus microplus]